MNIFFQYSDLLVYSFAGVATIASYTSILLSRDFSRGLLTISCEWRLVESIRLSLCLDNFPFRVCILSLKWPLQPL